MKKLSVGLIKKAIEDLAKEEYYKEDYEVELEAPFKGLKVHVSDGTIRIELKSGYNTFSMDFSVYSSGELYYHSKTDTSMYTPERDRIENDLKGVSEAYKIFGKLVEDFDNEYVVHSLKAVRDMAEHVETSKANADAEAEAKYAKSNKLVRLHDPDVYLRGFRESFKAGDSTEIKLPLYIIRKINTPVGHEYEEAHFKLLKNKKGKISYCYGYRDVTRGWFVKEMETAYYKRG